MKIRLEINGVFNKKIIQKKLSIKLNDDHLRNELFKKISEKIGKRIGSFENENTIILRNGSRFDENDLGEIKEGDIISVLSPLGGG